MRGSNDVRTLSVLCVGFLLAACSGEKAASDAEVGEADPLVRHQILGEHVNPGEKFPRIRFYDSGLVSLNDRCPVRRTKLSTKMPAVYVNGWPIGFC